MLDTYACVVNDIVTFGLIDEPVSEASFSACDADDEIRVCSLHKLSGVCAL